MTLSHLSICFDLDGTLIDTAPDLVRVLNLVIAQDNLPETDYLAARNQVGRGAKHLIREAYKRAGKSIEESRVQTLWELFLKLYADDIAQLSQPFPGVLPALRELKAEGANLSVCTNKPGFLARPLITNLNMDRFFDRIIGSGEGVTSKPSPVLIFAAAGHRRATNIVMVGDATPDVLAAKAAKVPIILMSYGYAETPCAHMRANKVLRSFRELPAAIKDLRI
jgi:phosphoglycolate phosphatase